MILTGKIFCEEEIGQAGGRQPARPWMKPDRSDRRKASVPTVDETKSVRPGKATGPTVDETRSLRSLEDKRRDAQSGLNRMLSLSFSPWKVSVPTSVPFSKRTNKADS